MAEPIEDIDAYLVQHQEKELLRFVAVGSVDDGKSTLIGRLLYDTHAVYEDQLAAVERASNQDDGRIDLSLVTDGLKAEREQGITIDVAYRYFSTDRRKFIIADTPGHIQYTRNMATGASTANVGIILIDARYGVLAQSRRHAMIASLLGIPHLAVAVNKMDLRDYDQKVFDDIVTDFRNFARGLHFSDVNFTPISALNGDNVVHRSDKTPWFHGTTMLEYLETVPLTADRNLTDFRYPVQYVLRPNLDYRAFAGEVASGVVKKGDQVLVLPSRKTSRIRAIDTFHGEIEEAYAPMSVALRLEDEVDVSRGDMLVHPGNEPVVGRRFEADLVWMSERTLDVERSYFLKHTTQMIRAEVEEVLSITNLDHLTEERAETLKLNDIGRVRICGHRALSFDGYRRNRATGAFILIDAITNTTVAAGMIIGPALNTSEFPGPAAGRVLRSEVSTTERRDRLRQSGATVWLVGTSAEQTERVAFALERKLYDLGHVAFVASSRDSIAVRQGSEWNAAPGALGALFETAERSARAGLVAIVASASYPEALVERTSGVLCRVSVGTASDEADLFTASDAGEPNVTEIITHLTRQGVFDQ